jgi:hypothetical protein
MPLLPSGDRCQSIGPALFVLHRDEVSVPHSAVRHPILQR